MIFHLKFCNRCNQNHSVEYDKFCQICNQCTDNSHQHCKLCYAEITAPNYNKNHILICYHCNSIEL